MRARVAAAVGGCAVLLLSACGSQVAPRDFVSANGRLGDNLAAGAALGAGGGPLSGAGANGSALPTTSTSAARGPGGAASGGGAGGTGGGASNNSAGGASGGSAISGITPGSCAGFTNGHGITDSLINLANVSDVSGPVPGLFASAQQAAKAYVAYFNSTSTVCGRKLKMTNYDSRTSTIGDQDGATSACSDTFAMVGSMGAFDNGGAQTVTQCGIPDLRAIITTPERFAAPVSFGTDSINPQQVSTAQYRYLKSITGDAYQHAAMVYLDAGAAVPNAKADQKTAESVGFHFDSVQAIDVTAFNYTPFASDMVNHGVKFVQYVGAWQYAIRLKDAMDQQGLKAAFMMDSVAYDPGFVTSGADAVNGTYAFVNTALFEEAGRTPEMQLYLKWLQQVAPGAKPSFFGIYAWGAVKLFSQLAVELGGKLNRQTMLTAIRATKSFDANGLFTPGDVGDKQTPPCQAIIQLENGSWVRRSPYPYTCSSVFNTQ